MLCNNCGNQIPDNSVNCPNCGAPTSAGGTQVPFGAPAAKVPFMQQTDTSINFIALIVAVLGFICVFPAKVVAKVSFWGVSQSEGVAILTKYGVYMLVLFALTAVLLFLKKSNQALVIAALNAIFCIFKMIQQLSSGAKEVKEAKEMGMDASVSLNFFFWMVIILSVVEVVAIFVLPKVMGKKQ